MKEKILEYLNGLAACESVSDTAQEKEAADYIEKELRKQSYFQKHPEMAGMYGLEGDALGRSVPYGLVRGKGSRTVVLTGHYDVVSAEDYGELQAFAFHPASLSEAIGKELEKSGAVPGFSGEATEDYLSGQWLFGRGTADMKGGLAVGLALADWFGSRNMEKETEGNLLFFAVPDEESYSAGMRGSLGLLSELRDKYGLSYEALFCLEPGNRESRPGTGQEEGKQAEIQQVYVGSVGKCMPTVLVQGKKAHTGECFEGLNAIGVLGEVFRATELSPAFGECLDGEVCMPPTWLQLRDRKNGYDVSVPQRAGGYFSALQFSQTPSQLMEALKKVGREAFVSYGEEMEKKRKAVLGAGALGEPARELCESAVVLEFSELIRLCQERMGADFENWHTNFSAEMAEKIRGGRLNFPQATLEWMEEALNRAGLVDSAMILAFSPPFYPAFHSDRLPGKEGAGEELFQKISRHARPLGLELQKGGYFSGISDLSYCGVCTKDPEAMAAYGGNTPLWGELYSLDFKAMEELNVPSVLFGPWGKDIHQKTERVHLKSLTKEVPEILKNIIEQMFAM